MQKIGENQCELTKMGVLKVARGLKAGEFLLKAKSQGTSRSVPNGFI